MFERGDLIVYGSTGVCRIEEIVTPPKGTTLHGMQGGCSYYVLQPLYQTETIYTPAENPRVFMRAVISKQEAEAFMRLIPSIQAEAFYSVKTQEVKEHYEAFACTHNCADLLALAMSIYAKKQCSEQQNRKLGQMDERYLKQAEKMLHEEFSVALGIAKDDVPEYIAQYVAALEQTAT